MTHPNTKCRRGLSVAMLALAIGSAIPLTANADADNFDITFKARIRETTCDMTINGLDSSASIPLGTGGRATIDEIVQNMDANSGTTITPFSLEMKNCPSSLSGIKTIITGTYAANNTVLIPSTSEDETATKSGGIGVKISRASAPTEYFRIFGTSSQSGSDTEIIHWNGNEIDQGKVELLARLVPMRPEANNTEPGAFQVTATFNFTYE
ncbi:fimbrial protein [Salmonella enterica]|nr:fimbrial protein [Salmonella enterica]EKT1627443.1 fimbrial protein [Salmonella enterica]